MALTANRLRELLCYDLETGVFTRRADRGSRWKAGTQIGAITRDGYRYIRVDRRLYKSARLAWLHVYGEWPNALVDHRDRDRLNDAIGNLRLATWSQNNGNSCKHRDNTSGHKGVSWDKARKKWKVQIGADRRIQYVGRFESKGDAVAAYAQAAQQRFGEFARP